MLLITTHEVFTETLNYSVFVDIFFIVYFWICFSSLRASVTEVIIHVEIDIHACLWKSYKIQTNWMNFGFSDMYMPHLIEKKDENINNRESKFAFIVQKNELFSKAYF